MQQLFTGSGHKLGSEDDESLAEADTETRTSVTRSLVFWQDGFSVEGTFYAYSDPENAQLLDAINLGTVPTALFNLQPGEDVQVDVQKRLNEPYPAPKASSFGGTGHRLGSPT